MFDPERRFEMVSLQALADDDPSASGFVVVGYVSPFMVEGDEDEGDEDEEDEDRPFVKLHGLISYSMDTASQNEYVLRVLHVNGITADAAVFKPGLVRDGSRVVHSTKPFARIRAFFPPLLYAAQSYPARHFHGKAESKHGLPYFHDEHLINDNDPGDKYIRRRHPFVSK